MTHLIPDRRHLSKLYTVATMLRRGEKTNASIIAYRMECCHKTAQRIIAILRDDCGWVLEYDSSCHTYRLVSAPPPVL